MLKQTQPKFDKILIKIDYVTRRLSLLAIVSIDNEMLAKAKYKKLILLIFILKKKKWIFNKNIYNKESLKNII